MTDINLFFNIATIAQLPVTAPTTLNSSRILKAIDSKSVHVRSSQNLPPFLYNYVDMGSNTDSLLCEPQNEEMIATTRYFVRINR